MTTTDRGRWPAWLGWWWVLPLAIFAVTRGVDALMIAQAAGHQAAIVPGHAPFVVAPMPASPGYLAALTNWDGQWYEQIALHGYPRILPRYDGQVTQNVWAFYPGYPALVRGVMELTRLPFAAAASLVSTLCGAAAMVLLHRLLLPRAGRFGAATTVLALCVFPSAPLFQAAYTESLGLLLIVLALGAAMGRRYAAFAVVCVIASLVRPIVLPLAAVLAVHGLLRWRRRHQEPFPRREVVGCAAAAVLAGLSFAIWPVVTGLVTGEARAYLETQAAWRRPDHKLSWGRALGELGGISPVLPVLAVAAAIAVFVLVIVRPRLGAWAPELRAWAVLDAAYTLVATRPEVSLVRYAMLTQVPWWPQEHEPGPERRRARIVLVSVLVVVGLVAQFCWVRWVLIPDPGALFAP